MDDLKIIINIYITLRANFTVKSEILEIFLLESRETMVFIIISFAENSG